MDLDEILEKYKTHPRVIEIRFILFFNMVAKDYGYQQTMKMFKAVCIAFNCNMVFLQSVINRRDEIQKNSKKKFTKWRQEVLFTCACYGESVYRAANDFLNVSPSSLYAQHETYNLEEFCTDEWLRNLDEEATLCAEQSFRLEVLRFFEVVDMFTDIFTKWKGGK